MNLLTYKILFYKCKKDPNLWLLQHQVLFYQICSLQWAYIVNKVIDQQLMSVLEAFFIQIKRS
jgi:hypothetical protein